MDFLPPANALVYFNVNTPPGKRVFQVSVIANRDKKVHIFNQ